jgi:alpha-amylase
VVTTARIRLCVPAIVAAAALALSSPASAQVLLQGFYWDVPSPSAGNPGTPWWWDRLASQAAALHSAGFTAVWIPPVTKGASGGYSVGYDPFDDYDLGAKAQKSPTPATRYGTREQLQRCAAALRANGLDTVLDLVENHRNGDPAETPFVFKYPGSVVGVGGRFEKGPSDFHPNVPPDPAVPDDSISFGRDLAHINSPNLHVFNGLIDAVDWTTRALDARGYRMDFMKGISTRFLLPFLNAKSMRGKFAVGEFWDQDRDKVYHWVHAPAADGGMEGRAMAFDFPLQHVLRNMCSDPNFDMRTLEHAGLLGIDPNHAVTFVENHDTDRNDGDKIVRGKMLAYAFILTQPGYPSVFYRDYSSDAGSYHLQPRLDPLLQIHERLARGASITRYADQNLFVSERLGGNHLLTALNRTDQERPLVTTTGFKPGTRLVDYAGHGSAVTVLEKGVVNITVPSNKDGAGYVCYAPAGQNLKIPAQPSHPTVQEFEGAADLDISPVFNGKETMVCRIWCRANTLISGTLSANNAGWSPDSQLKLRITAEDGSAAGQANLKASSGGSITGRARKTGWYTIRITGEGLPDNLGTQGQPFVVSVKYTAGEM